MPDQSDRLPLKRWPKTDEGLSRYRHPYAYVIWQERRTWSERGREPGRHHDPPPPLFWWEVKPLFGPKPRPIHTFDTLGEARDWCDNHLDRVETQASSSSRGTGR